MAFSNGTFLCFQKEITLKAQEKGCHLINEEIWPHLPDLKPLKCGTAHFYIKHTTASLVVCESWDEKVRADMLMVMDKIVPEKWQYQHDVEGTDDMPGHAKCALMGSSVTVPITNGKLNLGQWQGLWLCEHRREADERKIVVTIQGCQY
ncbi:uncharacterized protein [Watersipora subatra]|uniref:uncharacterized protein n=1 Tax=Watersipora subatra TaxID=2589382 RepID=UPI00355B25D2